MTKRINQKGKPVKVFYDKHGREYQSILIRVYTDSLKLYDKEAQENKKMALKPDTRASVIEEVVNTYADKANRSIFG